MKFTFWLAIYIVLNCAPHVRCYNAGAEVRVGVVSAITGPIAAPGTSIQNAFRLADEQNDLQDAVTFVFEDDQGTARNTVTAVKKLLDQSKVDALVTFMSPTSMSVADIAEQRKVPMIAIAMTSKILNGRSYVYKHYASTEGIAEAAIAELKRTRHERIAIVSSVHDALLTMRGIFVERTTAEIVFNEEVLPDDIELRSLAMKALKAGPDAVWINTNPPQTSIFAKLLREQNFKGLIFGSPPMANRNDIAAAHGALDDAWFATSDVSKAGHFIERYMKRFGVAPEPEGMQAYDLAMILIKAGEEGIPVSQHLSSLTSVEGILGTYPIKNHSFELNAAIVPVRDFVKIGIPQ